MTMSVQVLHHEGYLKKDFFKTHLPLFQPKFARSSKKHLWATGLRSRSRSRSQNWRRVGAGVRIIVRLGPEPDFNKCFFELEDA